MLDMAGFLFSFLAIELYFRNHYGWSAASMGLAFLAREFSIFAFVTIAIYHLAINRKMLKGALKIGLVLDQLGATCTKAGNEGPSIAAYEFANCTDRRGAALL